MNWEEVLGNLGWSGILAGALVYVFRLYTDVQEKRIEAMDEALTEYSKRVERCEIRADNCEADRRLIHEQQRKDSDALHRMIADYFPRKHLRQKDDDA